ncbi:MAG: hypothetical protein HXL03_02055 [Candidatus Nanosynbacter sp.]|jgi:hypothetical protein|nr:hypothetical protein [Candidatus Nanosynbacter sp.]
MTNEELAIKIDSLSDIVANLAKTMDERFKQIDQRFKQIDERFEQIDRRFELIDERFEQIDEQLADIRKDHKTLVDIVKDMDLAADERFQELKAGQAELAANQESLRADLAVVRRELYHESGSREMVDDTLYNSLDKRLRRVEAKFPDLASSQAA